jgi:hypothetical protein
MISSRARNTGRGEIQMHWIGFQVVGQLSHSVHTVDPPAVSVGNKQAAEEELWGPVAKRGPLFSTANENQMDRTTRTED